MEIRLEHEAHYDWIAFVPLCDSDAGALTKYFGKIAGEDEYKYRGIECRQRSTPSYIDDAQKALIRAGNTGDPTYDKGFTTLKQKILGTINDGVDEPVQETSTG